MNTPTVGRTDTNPDSRKPVVPSQRGVGLLLFMFGAFNSKVFESLLSVDIALIGTKSLKYSNFMRLAIVIVSVPIGLLIGYCDYLFTKYPAWVIAAGGALGLIYALMLRYSWSTRRYLKALDIVSNGNLYSLSFPTALHVTKFIQNLMDEKVAQIKSLHKSGSTQNHQERRLRRELEGQLIELVKVFDGVDGLYTGPAKTLIDEYTLVIGS